MINSNFDYGAMGGQVSHEIGLTEEPTYTRIYRASGGSDDLRQSLKHAHDFTFNKGLEKVGLAYSYAPPWCPGNFNSDPGSLPGGGYFKILQTFPQEDPQKNENCFFFAIKSYGARIEQIAQKTLSEIKPLVSQDISSFVSTHFVAINEPRDGDLVVYRDVPTNAPSVLGPLNTGSVHAGIFRETARNWASPSGGTVESKWGYLNPSVYGHDVFFALPIYGPRAEFYRLKD